ncbi:D-alanyl-D-alanine carboxypeptidase family protein [Zongyangia hominis]|uniref:D-alanyl-D-alanine carboxypeptidase n=1 Tax=Zongyangia hominis TaxID=2763677 RepID=A0A926IB24_9FIRM|nr:D-alanyl-D-alanine carboxypeptidase family protein [Zongyangia hominis]MBC8569685.1 D-alanyl-D-alanine carboxypeptidase [Zongyangia hominis]
MKKWMAVLAVLLICSMMITMVYGIDSSPSVGTSESVSDTTPACTISPNQIISETAVLMEADSGQVLYDKQMNERMYPASLTKIMTAILALENGEMDNVLTVDQEILDDVYSYGLSTSHIALTVGERISLQDALYAALLESANDATALIAKFIGGTLDHFVEMMNQKAAEIGATHTHFVNVHGLHSDNHYTTAYDLALMMRYALSLPEFEKIISTAQYTMAPTNNQESERYFWNQNKMIQPSYYYNEDTVGGKLGWTEEATNTMAALGERNGRRLICVLLKSTAASAKYKDCELLFNYGFENFQRVEIDVSDDIPKGVDIQDENGDLCGDVTISSPPKIHYLIHNHLTANDIKIDINVPEHYTLGQPMSASFTVGLKDWVDCMPNEPLTTELTTKSNVNTKVMSVTKEPKTKGPNVFLLVGIGILVFLGIAVAALFVIRAVIRRGVRQRYAISRRNVHFDRQIRRRL